MVLNLIFKNSVYGVINIESVNIRMRVIDYVLLGIIQGITEWLPISSSGQSMIVMLRFFNLKPEAALSIAFLMHTGTLFAVILRFRKDIYNILKFVIKFKEDNLTLFLFVSTLSSGVVGIFVYMLLRGVFLIKYGDFITLLIGFCLLLTGILLYSSKTKFGKRGILDMKIYEMVIAGIAQGFSVLPGISRSGTTIATLLFIGMNQEDALRLSFLMSIPAVIGVISVSLITENLSTLNFNPVFLLIGITAAFISGYITIDFLLRISKRIRFDIFCMIFGLLTIVLGLFNYL
ncbi:MAG: hypothetical protein DRO90_02145 [Candidatus Altiarchaeales archaeon]|nr:MAG: hypothetical protein DRO90_02145 [Candidatus Altiarchaeales archaeon]